MTAAERQELIMATLRRERSAKIDNLAKALGCSERTIRRDIEALTVVYPLETSPGRYSARRIAARTDPPFRRTRR